MLSVGKLTTGAEDYYLETVAKGREEYYTGAGEAPGTWLGHGSERLGLVGTVDPEVLRTVLGGHHPKDGRDLTAGRTAPSGRVAGFDCTFSAPKSVSLLWALSQPGFTVATAVRTAHDRAAEEAVRYLESHAFRARRGAGGEHRIATTGLVGAAFRHRTSRNGDPQLHTHVLVANVAEGLDGRWSAPDARLVYFHARTAGFVYQAALRANLAESVGARFGPVRNGMAEVLGVPDQLLSTFSTRRAEIATALDRHGAHSARAAEIAALATRRSKGRHGGTESGLHEHWRSRVVDQGIDPSVVERAVDVPHRPAVSLDAERALSATLLAPSGLTRQVSAFEPRDVVRAVAESLPDGGHLADIEALSGGILNAPGVVALSGAGAGGEGRRTTAELLAVESRLLSETQARQHAGVGTVPKDTRLRVLMDSPQLADEQRRMVERLTTSGHGVEVVVGKAGSGKTTALRAARATWEADGYTVSGTALSARAATELAEGAGVQSVTLAGLLAAVSTGNETFGPRHVLVVDEAGMVGTRDLDRLVRVAGAVTAKLVLVGDPRQLPEIDAGGAFGALAGRLGAIELTENRRQDEPWERSGLDEVRSGDISVALQRYDEHHRIHVAPTVAEARQAMVADWLEARAEGGVVRMLAATRREAELLNELARSELTGQGRLGSVVAEGGGRGFALGDAVVCLRNDRRIGVVNGTRGTVVAGSPRGGLSILEGDHLRYLPAHYLADGHLGYGYATTIHKSQGETVGRAFVLANDALFREAAYVALSRARTRTDLYVPQGSFEDGRGPDVGQELPMGLGRSLSQSRAKSMAHESLTPDPLSRLRRVLAEPTDRDQISHRSPSEPVGLGRERLFDEQSLGLDR